MKPETIMVIACFGTVSMIIFFLGRLIVGLGSQLFDSSVLSFVAAAVLALGFQPARDRARRLADRLVYGAIAHCDASNARLPTSRRAPT